MDSDAGLVTGEYFLDHQLVTYQSQGQNIGIDLQYSSAQADPTPVVQYQFTTPLGGRLVVDHLDQRPGQPGRRESRAPRPPTTPPTA